MEHDDFECQCGNCGHRYTVRIERCEHQEEMLEEIRCPECDPDAEYDDVVIDGPVH